MSARELCSFAYTWACEGRSDVEREELDEWLQADPGELAARERVARLEAISAMGGSIVEVNIGDNR